MREDVRDIFTKEGLLRAKGLSTWIFAVHRRSGDYSILLRTFVYEEDAKSFVHECRTLAKYPCDHVIEKVLLRF